jgi:hypothetical protein
MIDKEKSGNIFHKEMSKRNKNNSIEKKLKEGLDSMKHSKKEEDNNNLKEIKHNKENYLNKYLVKKKEEE